MISVHGKERKQRHQLQTLTKYIFRSCIVRPVVIGIQCQDAAPQRIHQIRAGRLHNDIPHKAGGKAVPEFRQHILQLLKLHAVGQPAEQQQIHHLFITKPFLGQKTVHNLFYVNSLIIQFPLTWDHLPVHYRIRPDL